MGLFLEIEQNKTPPKIDLHHRVPDACMDPQQHLASADAQRV
jgi:hypothetical protein